MSQPASIVSDITAARLRNLRKALRLEAARKIFAKCRGWTSVAAAREERCAALRFQIAQEEGRAHG